MCSGGSTMLLQKHRGVAKTTKKKVRKSIAPHKREFKVESA